MRTFYPPPPKKKLKRVFCECKPTLYFQVSENKDPRPVVYTRRNEAGENSIYNHLHEDHIEHQDQSDYDHCPPHVDPEDMYSHLDSAHDNSEDYMGDYGDIN